MVGCVDFYCFIATYTEIQENYTPIYDRLGEIARFLDEISKISVTKILEFPQNWEIKVSRKMHKSHS